MTIRVLHGDCRDVLPTLAANSVHCVVTSPPYYGLRDYGTAQWDGGDAGCDHLQRSGQRQDVGRTQIDGFHGSSLVSELTAKPFVGECGKCGARRIDRQLGLEATPDEYIQTMVAVFREVRRVLRDDGTCWVNMGDSYASSGAKQTGRNDGGRPERDGGYRNGRWTEGAWTQTTYDIARSSAGMCGGAKPKDLLMMPARLALALQADGWWLRSDIIWAKPNPMPESVTDRPTSAHEHVFLLSKRSSYFYDADAVREEELNPGASARQIEYQNRLRAERAGLKPELVNHSMAWRGGGDTYVGGRNLRNVWTIATHAYPEAHFATFPPELAERCIKAGTSERGCCAQCGAPWVRVTEETEEYAAVKAQLRERLGADFHMKRAGLDAVKGQGTGTNPATLPPKSVTTGWSSSCTCQADVVPCTVLDPFAGAGTTMLVADRLQRHAIGIELNEAYAMLARNRIVADAPLFAEVAD